MKKWYEGVDGQRKAHATLQSGSSPDAQTEQFTWMRDQTAPITNPYAQEEDDDDEDYTPPQNSILNSTYPGPNQGMTRNASNTSLRTRSTTGESTQSLAGIARAPPPRFPMLQNPPLSLQTSIASSIPSPGQRLADSYFSPVAESPASSRTSTASSMFPFPRQGTPQGSGWGEDHNRYTAPAMPRAPSRGRDPRRCLSSEWSSETVSSSHGAWDAAAKSVLQHSRHQCSKCRSSLTQWSTEHSSSSGSWNPSSSASRL